MKVPVEITFRDVRADDSTEELIRKRAEKLEKFCSYLSSCRVVVERESQRQKEGNPYSVRIDLTVPPSHEIVVSRDPAPDDQRDDLPVVIRRAFDAAQRQLKELVEKQRNEVKTHPEQDLGGVVVRLFRDESYGFLRDLEGREIYFHRNAMSDSDWARLEIGTGVNYFEYEGEGRKGPQASAVRIVDKPGVRAAKVEQPLAEPPLGWEHRRGEPH